MKIAILTAATLIFYYYKKGDIYEDVTLAAATYNVYVHGNGGDGFKGGDSGIPLGVPTSWKDVKLIQSEDDKLCVILLILWEGVKIPRSKDLKITFVPQVTKPGISSCRGYQALVDFLSWVPKPLPVSCRGNQACVNLLIPWNGVKLIRPEGLKLRVPFLIPRDGVESPGPKTLNCKLLPVIFDGLWNGDLCNYEALFTQTILGTRFYLRVEGYFLVFCSVRRHTPYAPPTGSLARIPTERQKNNTKK